MTELERLRAEAKDLGIANAHVKGAERLKSEISALKVDSETVGDSSIVGEERTATENIWLYHKTEKPRVFKAGENIPDGWDIENRKHWTVTHNGKFVNVNG